MATATINFDLHFESGDDVKLSFGPYATNSPAITGLKTNLGTAIRAIADSYSDFSDCVVNSSGAQISTDTSDYTKYPVQNVEVVVTNEVEIPLNE